MPKVVDIEATKMRIVRATWAVITSEGIQSVSMRRVATEANSSTGLITHYFRDKDELVTYAYRVVLDKMIADATRSVQRERGVTDRLLAAVEAIEPTNAQMKQFTVVLMNFWGQAAFNEAYAARCRQDYRRWRDLIGRVVREGVASGELYPDTDVRAVTDLVTLLSDGLSVGMTLTPNAYPADRRRALIQGILAPHTKK
jgi:TetR/AcrR family transcriptional repressor of bet genes